MGFGQEPAFADLIEMVCYRWDWPLFAVSTDISDCFALPQYLFLPSATVWFLLTECFRRIIALQNCSIKCESWPTLLKCYTPFSHDWNPRIIFGLINWSMYSCASNQSTTCRVGLVLPRSPSLLTLGVIISSLTATQTETFTSNKEICLAVIRKSTLFQFSIMYIILGF